VGSCDPARRSSANARIRSWSTAKSWKPQRRKRHELEGAGVWGTGVETTAGWNAVNGDLVVSAIEGKNANRLLTRDSKTVDIIKHVETVGNLILRNRAIHPKPSIELIT
jgi:hypothetical protein